MKNIAYNTTLVLTSLMALAACGGSSSTVERGVTLGEVRAQGLSLFEAVDAASPIETDAIPTSGTASYAGILSFSRDAGPDTEGLVGQVDMTVGFTGAGSVDGTVSDFVYGADSSADPSTILPEVDGVLTFENGSINRMAGPDDAQFGAEFTGTLNAPVEMFGIAAGTDVAVDGGFGGFFYEGAIAGEVGGTMTPDGGAAIEIDGSILAVTP